jgi:hypothetical protein
MRFTVIDINGDVSLPETVQNDAIKLLAAFEDVCTELAESHKTIPEELEKMRVAVKDKTVRYKEMFAHKLYNLQIAALQSEIKVGSKLSR